MSDNNLPYSLQNFDFWPHDKFAILENQMDKIKLGFVGVDILNDILTFSRAIVFENAISIELPELAGFGFIIGDVDEPSNYTACITIGEAFRIGLENIKIKLKLPRTLLKPVIPRTLSSPAIKVGDQYEIKPEGNVEIEVTTNVEIDEKFVITVDGFNDFNIPPMMIGDTGIIIDVSHASLILSSSQADACNLPEDWRGIKIDSAKIYFPPEFQMGVGELEGSDLLIGSGGLSGRFHTKMIESGTFYGLDFSLTRFDVNIVQNVIINSLIQGTVTIPFFDVPVKVDLGLTSDGDFIATASTINGDGLLEVTKDGIFKLKVGSIRFEKKNDVGLIHLSGYLKILEEFADLDEIEIKSLTIDSNGNVLLDGGWLPIPKQLSFSFHGFPVEVTKIGFGQEAGWKWITLHGGIQLMAEISLRSNIEGLKIKWNPQNQIEVEMSGVEVGLTIPNVLAFEGEVSFENGGFSGGVKLEIFPINLGFNAQLRFGKFSGQTYLYIFLEGKFPVGIPLYSTGLALWGISGLYGQNVKPNKTPEQSWLAWAKGGGGPPSCADVEKWPPSEDAVGHLALGAGALIGTMADRGYSFNANVILILLIPGPVILIEGHADFLTKMGTLNHEGVFYTLAVLDCHAGNFLFNVEAQYALPKDGLILDIHGSSEAFFDFHNPLNWYLYLGQKEPTEKRLRAEFLNLFEANSYFMLGRYNIDGWKFGVATGAKIGYDRKWKFGPVKVRLEAWIEGNAFISFKPPQLGGDLWLQGGLNISIFGIGFGLSVGAGVEGNTPKPYLIRAEFKIKINLPWPLPDPKVKVVLEWKEEREPDFECPLEGVSIEHLKVSNKLELEIHDTDEDESIILAELNPNVPLDGRPAAVFSKPMFDEAGIGVNREPLHVDFMNCEMVPPEKPEHGVQYEVIYKLTNFKLEYRTRQGNWDGIDGIIGKVNGFWLADTKLPPTIADMSGMLASGNFMPSMTKLMLWVKSPFYYYQGQIGPESVHYSSNYYPSPCELIGVPETHTITFDEYSLDEKIYFIAKDIIIIYLADIIFPLTLISWDHWDWAGVNQGVKLLDYDFKLGDFPLTIFFHEAVTDVRIFMGRCDFYYEESESPVESPVYSMRAFYDGEVVWESEEITPNGQPFSIPIENEESRIDRLDILRSRNAVLLKICYVTFDEILAQEEYNLRVELRSEEIKEVWEGEHPILRPNTDYKMTIETTVRYRKESEGEWKEKDPVVKYAYFRTGGPPLQGGPSAAEMNEAFMDLNDLRHYVLRTIPFINLHHPHHPYRAYDVGIEFNESYVEAMYVFANMPLYIQLFDNNDRPLNIRLKNQWSDSPQTQLDLFESLWLEVINNCWEGIGEYMEGNKTLYLISNYTLQPKTFYTAKLMAKKAEWNAGIAVFQFSFVTSQFSTFIHHIHSFQNAAWDYHKLLGQPDTSLLDEEKLQKLNDTISECTAKNIEESKAFQVIYDEVFGLGYCALPNVLEITVLRDGNSEYGLLLESPEPIDWTRISLKIYQMQSTIFHELKVRPTTSPIKIIEAAIHSGPTDLLDTNWEWMDLLLQVDFNPSGVIIEYCDIFDFTSLHPYNQYFQFNDEKTWPAGTVFRIHTGKKPLFDPDPQMPERIHRHAGLNSKCFFDVSTFQILNKNGDVISKHQFFASAYFNELTNFTLIVNADLTRAFLFLLADPSNFVMLPHTERIRLEFTFNRMKDSESIVLKRAGNADPVTTAIEFSFPPQLPE